MIVDDEPTIRMVTAEVLREAGYRIIEAADGPSALHALKSAPKVHMLVTDIGLPGGLNGRQLAAAVQSERPNIKVLLITGYAHNVAEDGRLTDGAEIMIKPFDMDALAQKIKRMLAG